MMTHESGRPVAPEQTEDVAMPATPTQNSEKLVTPADYHADLEGGARSFGDNRDSVPEEDDPSANKELGNSPRGISVKKSDIVDWDGPDDPANPRNWSKSHKMASVVIVSLAVLSSNIATTMFAPGSLELAHEFGITSSFVLTLTVTIPSLGAALGPLIFAPLSELYGRFPVYWASTLLYLAFTVGCARSTNVAMFLVFRFVCGACAASFVSLGGGTIADLLVKEERGTATALFTSGPLLGPVLGPIIGGFVTQSLGWRWTFYLVLMLSGAVSVFALLIMRETYSTVLLDQKAARLRKETGNQNLQPAGPQRPPANQLLKPTFVRPLCMLFLSPVVVLIGWYMAVAFGLTYLLFATFPEVFQDRYAWKTEFLGLAYIGVGIGCAIGLRLFAYLSDKPIQKGGGPEKRLLLMIYFGPALPAGMFWYGWTANYGLLWIAPIVGTAFVGLGSMLITSSAQIYMLDLYGPKGGASALAATMLVRNASGCFLALAADPLYKSIGLGWGNSVLGFIALAFAPVPIVLYKYGETLRKGELNDE